MSRIGVVGWLGLAGVAGGELTGVVGCEGFGVDG